MKRSPTPSPSASRLLPHQRRRLRKIVRASLIGVVAIEAVAVLLVVVAPRVGATGLPVIDAAVLAATNMVYSALGGTNSRLDQANDYLLEIRDDTREIRNYADQHAQPLNDNWSADLAAVTATPTDELRGLSFAEPNPGNAMRTLVPGAVQWEDYYTEYAASADTVLSTLRSSLDVLYKHNEQIEDDAALTRISGLASSTNSRLAMGELKVQSNLEVARQLHALRAQHALETSLYAVTESHRIGTEARTIAEDRYANCRTLTSIFTGGLDAAVGGFFC